MTMDEVESPQAIGRRWQFVVVAIAIAWLTLITVLLVRSSTPSLGIGPRAEHMIIGSVVAFVVVGLLSLRRSWAVPTLAWTATVVATIVIVALELLQLVAPARAFQLDDLVYSFPGVVVGSVLGAVLAQATSPQALVKVVATVAGVGFVAALVVTVVRDPAVLDAATQARLTECTELTEQTRRAQGSQTQGSQAQGRWDNVVLTGFRADTESSCVLAGSASVAALTALNATTVFTAFAGEIHLDPESGTASFGRDGGQGGLLSTPLAGLGEQISNSEELTVGVRFRLRDREIENRPSILVQLTIGPTSNRYVAQLFHRGPHLGANIGTGTRFVGAGVGLAESVTDGDTHEFVVTYRGGTAVAYLDGAAFTTYQTNPLQFVIDDELRLAIGRRADEAWHPLDGDIERLVVSARAVEPGEVPTVFDR